MAQLTPKQKKFHKDKAIYYYRLGLNSKDDKYMEKSLDHFTAAGDAKNMQRLKNWLGIGKPVDVTPIEELIAYRTQKGILSKNEKDPRTLRKQIMDFKDYHKIDPKTSAIAPTAKP